MLRPRAKGDEFDAFSFILDLLITTVILVVLIPALWFYLGRLFA